MTVPCELCGERIDITNIEPTPTKWNPPDHVCGQWHTYKKTYDVHIDREGEIVVTWHGTSEVVPGDDRDLIQWAFDQGREFERVQPTRWKASPANWCEATMAERDLTMREAAVKIHEVFLSLMDAGFTEQQALYLCGQTMSGGSNDG